ncbi:hypothetical protein [Mesobacterium pallidum]|uniref:hypothetical protein n=1 Tax=Mesobacterium pallidum TaxID=2872037 RepID=UPI001EE1FF27|nr:hypothetical protein [Mesobacterium pallidum]
MSLRNHPWPVLLIWAFLVFELVSSLLSQRWTVAFVALATLGLSVAPTLLAERLNLRLPVPFVVAIVAFVFGTLFLGEVLDFYNRYWWWDVALHGASAVTFGMVGFLFVFYLFEGDRYAAPPWAMALIAFCFAVTIGAIWEIFEYTMDQTFGTNMQKSGLQDTMWDLIVDVIGGAVGASAGWLYLGGHREGTPARVIDQFVRMNRRLFRKAR